ncbi:ATP-binding protein [Lentisphaerota bacterium WC36G]|nr:PAS domain-containing protein [Lentisphaerae bacterium WC36]
MNIDTTIFSAIGLTFVEMTFVFLTLLILHGLRSVIGQATFYISLGMLFIFIIFMSSAELTVNSGISGVKFNVAETALFLPYLAVLLIVYVTEGVLAAQRLIIATVVALLFYMYLGQVTVEQSLWQRGQYTQGPLGPTVEQILIDSTRRIMEFSGIQLLSIITIPIVYQWLRNVKCGLFFCVLGALLTTQVCEFFFNVFLMREESRSIFIYSDFMTARLVSLFWIASLSTVYLRRVSRHTQQTQRRTFEIFYSFFGNYGRNKALQEHLVEWEGRYRMVVENATELILLVSSGGRILDANYAAVNMLHKNSRTELKRLNFKDIIKSNDNKQLDFSQYLDLSSAVDMDMTKTIDKMRFSSRKVSCIAPINEDNEIHLELTISPINFKGVEVYIVLGRDVSEEFRLGKEKKLLQEQLMHSQRLDSIGKLAGGIAHDFNNCLHSILGHVDVLKYIHGIEDEKIIHHLDKIATISEQSAELTKQLLGFAREGKFNPQKLNLSALISQSMELFLPNKKSFVVDIKKDSKYSEMYITGDQVQLQQVMLNLLINARDAVEAKTFVKNETPQIEIIANDPLDNDIKIAPPEDVYDKDLSKYYCLVIKDNGTGIPKKIRNRVFDPFFTTKKIGEGTGMGLAMVYGTIVNHHGWLQLTSKQNEGTAFYIFLPKADAKIEQITKPRKLGEKLGSAAPIKL